MKKPILKLTEEDYNEDGLQDLLASRGTAYDINIEVFRDLQQTITGWPGGKPAHARRAGDSPRFGDGAFPKRVLIFSPHPDDDVISMGGTLIRLVDQGHEVHVAYQTSGNIAVFDDDAVRVHGLRRRVQPAVRHRPGANRRVRGPHRGVRQAQAARARSTAPRCRASRA